MPTASDRLPTATPTPEPGLAPGVLPAPARVHTPIHHAPAPMERPREVPAETPRGAPAETPREVPVPALVGEQPPVRASLHPGTLVVVRDSGSVQVGLSPDRAVVVAAPAATGPRRLAALLDELDGGADLSDAAARAGIASAELPAVARVLVHLEELGHVRIHRPGVTADPDHAPRPGPVRRVHLLGAGQVSDVLRGPLSVNGCRVTASPSPGLALDPSRPPWNRRGPTPDLVILAGPVSVDPVITLALARSGQPHLHVHCRDGRVVVGPTVVPGDTPCLRCANLYRADRDPRWPFVAAQLIDRTPRAAVPALTAAAALVLAEVAATREPGRPLQTIGATVEINPAEGLWLRREWPADVRCPCGAAPVPNPLP